MFSDTGHNYSGTLLHGFFGEYTCHVLGIDFIQVADRLVHEQEIERLAKGTDERYALLLTEGHLPDRHVYLIADAQLKEQVLDILLSE